MLNKLLSIANKIVPKGTFISFSSFPDFSDNSRSLFEYIQTHDTVFSKYKIVWHIDNFPNEIDVSKYKNTIFVRKKTIRALWYFMRSKYIFSTHGLYNVIKTTKKQRVCLLWHGMPLKKIGYLYEQDAAIGVQEADYFFVTSRLFQTLFSKIFRAVDSQIIISGQPRNDELFNCETQTALTIKGELGENLVFYLPTYRKSNIRNTIDGDIEIDKFFGASKKEWIALDEKFHSAGKNLVIKPHPMETANNVKFFSSLTNVKVIDDVWLKRKGLTLYKLLSQCEALITDYSSVYVDYLILNRPIIFFVPDIEKYNDSRGFVFENIYDYLPGPVVKNFIDIPQILLDVDKYKDKRNQVNSLFNEVNDSTACSNIMNFISSLM